MVSIVTSLFKSDRYLDSFSEHLNNFTSELENRNFSFEIIIVANEPTDRELEFLKTFSSKPWFRSITVKRETFYASLNRGIASAKGQVLGFWNVDDIRFPEAVIEAEKLVKHGADVAYFPFYIKRYLTFGSFSLPVMTTKVQGQVLEFEKRKFETNMTTGPHFMFSKQAYDKVGPFDEQFKIAGDFDWSARAARMGLSFALGKEFSGVFRVDGNGLSAGTNQQRTAENNVVYIRIHAWDKLVSVDDVIIRGYRTKSLKFQNGFKALNLPYK